MVGLSAGLVCGVVVAGGLQCASEVGVVGVGISAGVVGVGISAVLHVGVGVVDGAVGVEVGRQGASFGVVQGAFLVGVLVPVVGWGGFVARLMACCVALWGIFLQCVLVGWVLGGVLDAGGGGGVGGFVGCVAEGVGVGELVVRVVGAPCGEVVGVAGALLADGPVRVVFVRIV